MLGQIRQADQQAVNIIQHLKKLLKRRSEVETQEFDLNDVIADAIYILFPEARDRNVALHANDARQPLLVRADRVHLQQAIVSLTMNGMDAMIDTALDARRITIKAALRAEASWSRESSNGVEARIEFLGAGMSKASRYDLICYGRSQRSRSPEGARWVAGAPATKKANAKRRHWSGLGVCGSAKNNELRAVSY
jgi:signal transduction histidine kinase